MQQEGIDPAEISNDQVTPSTIRRHLRECVTPERNNEATVDFAATEESLRALQSKTRIVFERTIDRLMREGFVSSGDFNIEVHIRYRCNECGDTRDAFQFLRMHGCSCSSESNT